MNKLNTDMDDREFPMTASDFEKIKTFAMQWTGITLTDHKKNMIYGRLSRRLRKLSLSRFSEYCKVLKDHPETEKTDFINAITTNLTSFFREQHHFDYLKNTLIDNLMIKNNATKKIRIWSAGCSTGEEPYSIAMVLRNHPKLAGWDVKILATDLDTNVVATASKGEYGLDRIESVGHEYKRYFSNKANSDSVEVVPEVKSLIRFRPLNLLETWPMKNPFDIIFCRNVVIYFNLETQKKLFNRYADTLHDNAYIFIGHSENLYKVTNRFEGVGRTIYQKQY